LPFIAVAASRRLPSPPERLLKLGLRSLTNRHIFANVPVFYFIAGPRGIGT
jgi:hypothetical protein